MLILLTGSQHVGKTTACWKTIPYLRATGVRVAGFVSPPLLDENGATVGIEMMDLTTGKHQTFARRVAAGEPATVGLYRMVEGATDWARHVLAAALLANADWLVVDEIGPLELHEGGGFAFALEALADPLRVPNAIVIVREELMEELAERLGRPDMVRLRVTEGTRAEVPARLVKLIRAA
jgi:nucleoside-triphosphatase THEP1